MTRDLQAGPSSAYVLVVRGGAASERGAATLARRVAAAGHNVTVAFLDRGRPSVVDALDTHRGHKETVVLVALALTTDVQLAGWTRRVASDWAARHDDAPPLTLARPLHSDAIAETIARALDSDTFERVPVTPRMGALSDPGWSDIPSYRHHVLVCRGPRCTARGASRVTAALQAALEKRGLSDDHVLVAHTDCLYPCNRGPMLVVNPGDTWYQRLTPTLVHQIVDRHLVGGEILPESAIRAPDGKRA